MHTMCACISNLNICSMYMEHNLVGESKDFSRFKESINDLNIPSLTKDWWNELEESIKNLIDYVDPEGVNEDVSKIVILTTIIGYAYLQYVREMGDISEIPLQIDTIYKHIPSEYKPPLEDGIINRRNFINFLNILINFVERTKLYRSLYSIEMEDLEERYCKKCHFSFKDKMCPYGHSNINYTKKIPTGLESKYCRMCKTVYKGGEIAFKAGTCPKGHTEWKGEVPEDIKSIPKKGTALKRGETSSQERWERKDGKWVHKEDISEDYLPNNPIPELQFYENPANTLINKMNYYLSFEDIIYPVKVLLEKEKFLNLIILLKDFVTRAYQMEDKYLDYKIIDDRVTLKDVTTDLDRKVNKYTFPLDMIDQKEKNILNDEVNRVFVDILNPEEEGRPPDVAFSVWARAILEPCPHTGRSAVERGKDIVLEALSNIDKPLELPGNYEALYTAILIVHTEIFKKQLELRMDINYEVIYKYDEFREISRVESRRHFLNIVSMISELWGIMFAWYNLYCRIYGKYIWNHYLYEKDHIRFIQTMLSTELSFWLLYLTIRFKTTEYKDGMDLSPDPNTFKKIFTRVKEIKKRLEPRLSNPPIIVMPHLHGESFAVLLQIERMRRYGNISNGTYLLLKNMIEEDNPSILRGKTDPKHFKYRYEIIYENEKALIDALRYVHTKDLEIKSLIRDPKYSVKTYEDHKEDLSMKKQTVNWLFKGSCNAHEKGCGGYIIDIVNSSEMDTLIEYYENLLEEDETLKNEIQIGDFQDKYNKELSMIYDFDSVEYRMINNAVSISDESLPNSTEENMLKVLKEEGNLDRILHISYDEDEKGETIHETVYMEYWPERKLYLDNILKEIKEGKEEEEVLDDDLSDLMKEGQGNYDPLQKQWLSGKDLDNPMEQFKGEINEQHRNIYGTTTEQGKMAYEASRMAKKDINFRDIAKRPRLYDKLIKVRPPTVKGPIMETEWIRNGLSGKYKYYSMSQFLEEEELRWGESILPQKIIDAKQKPLLDRKQAYIEAFEEIDLDTPLKDSDVYSTFIEVVSDIQQMIDSKKPYRVKMPLIDTHGDPMLDSDDTRGIPIKDKEYKLHNMFHTKAYAAPISYPLEQINEEELLNDLDTLTIEKIANFELPLKIGTTLDGEDVYHIRPFLIKKSIRTSESEDVQGEDDGDQVLMDGGRKRGGSKKTNQKRRVKRSKRRKTHNKSRKNL